MPCPTPKKVKYKNKVNAQKGAVMALAVFGHKQADFYKCICGKWHFTTQRDGMDDKYKKKLEKAKKIREMFGTNRAKLKKVFKK